MNERTILLFHAVKVSYYDRIQVDLIFEVDRKTSMQFKTVNAIKPENLKLFISKLREKVDIDEVRELMPMHGCSIVRK